MTVPARRAALTATFNMGCIVLMDKLNKNKLAILKTTGQ